MTRWRRYRLVTSIRGNSLKGMISIESPLGKAIRGHKEGDRVEVKVSDSYSYFVRIQKLLRRKMTEVIQSGDSRKDGSMEIYQIEEENRLNWGSGF